MARNEVIDPPDRPAQPALPAPPWGDPATRRHRRGPRPQLDRARIVAAALRIVDTRGIEGMTVRRLADDLDVTPMSIYWHVPDKATLLELVGQAVLGEMEAPPATGDWRRQLLDLHRSMLLGFLRHPNTGELLIGRARYGSSGLGLFERILSILLEAGFGPEAAFDAYQSLYLFTLGFMATASRSPEFRAIQQQGVKYMAGLPADRFPSIRAVVPTIGRRSLEEQFELGLEVAIDGIAARLAPRAAASGA